jgi:uncharacterized protein YggE
MRSIPLLACMAVGLLFATPSAFAEDRPLRSLTVTGMTQEKFVPDEAHVVVNLNAQDVKLATAKQMHDAKLKKLLAIAQDHTIDDRKIATQSANTQPVYRYETDPRTGEGKQILLGYRVQSNIDITVGETSKVASLMDAITNAGFEQNATQEWGNLLSMYYSFSNPQKIREDMLVAALKNARDKAERMANAAGARIEGVYQITEGNVPVFSPPPVPMMAMAGGASADASMEKSIAPPAGEQEMNASVTVVFELR